MDIYENLSPKITQLFYKRVKKETNKYKEHSFNDVEEHSSELRKIKEKKAHAKELIFNDPYVQVILDEFQATLIEQSIQPEEQNT